MENFIVSARKYRPATFETVVGQQHITGTLKNAIKNNQLAQAFLFCGPRGVGKTTCARILAKTINCTQLSPEIEACGSCDNCLASQQGNSFNIHELDAASNNSVDDIRSLIEQVRIPPQSGKYKIYIIDEVHMLSQSAFNAFLKTLEEPPSYAIFILATTEKHKILPTILSRCQIFDFNRIQIQDIAAHLSHIAQRESIAFEPDGLHIIAQKADGGLRDALSMFDQIASYSNKNISYKAVIDNLNLLDYDYYFKISEALMSGDISASLLIFDEILDHGFDGNHFIIGLASHLRNLLVGKDPGTLKLLDVSDNIRQKYLNQSKAAELSFILTALNLANTCDLNYKSSKNQRLQVELALIKMCHIHNIVNLAHQPLNASAEADKKKTLTQIPPKTEKAIAPVEASPVAAASSYVAPAPTAVTEPIADIAETPIQKVTTSAKISISSNLGSIPGMIPSLSDIGKKDPLKEDEEPKEATGAETTGFEYEQLLEIWNNYAEEAKNNGKIHVFTLLTTNAPQLENSTDIVVLTENSFQITLLQEEKIYLLNHLRYSLKNFSINISHRMMERKHENRLYTNTEKYEYLVQKNPKLLEMRRAFNLDLIP